ncbi:hypothetical protein [Hydrogenivirga sp. 128-5-R1-1]|uniref:hypothetical protein n=1 Tax=Hydrogenivirga sp. 128-5-R1-1 TaxID=392423 RepID=UPI00015F1499|nr:hypothetical protein [Hydrogenivirga sp. 128-5-R1-1]EDP73054.1 hypothetical protein HG1285_04453 [Hydrogenivirga sp. 128-5-R1-1]
MTKFDKIFFAEIVQDIPLWLSLIMGIYPDLQNKWIFFFSLFLGSIASIYIIKMIKEGQYSPGVIEENPSASFSFSIYSVVLIFVLIFASFKNMLYMESFVWGYLIVFSALELIFFLKTKSNME